MIKKFALGAVAALGTFALAGPALAVPVTFESVCVTDCDGDAGFSLTITLDDSVIAPNGSYETRSDAAASFLGWTVSSNVGGGFSVSGGFGDLLGLPNFGLIFQFDAGGVLSGILENGPNDVFTFASPEIGVVVFREPNEIILRSAGTGVGGIIQDADPFLISFRAPQTQLPEPASLALFGLGLLGLGVAVRRRERRHLHAALTVTPAKGVSPRAGVQP